jgi:hypothetical protein
MLNCANDRCRRFHIRSHTLIELSTLREGHSQTVDYIVRADIQLKPNSRTYNFVEVFVHNLKKFSDLRSPCNFYITNQFQITQGEGLKSVSRDDCEKQGGKLLRL